MAILRELDSMEKPTSTLAVAPEGAFLAAGMTDDSEDRPALRIIQSTGGNLSELAEFPSPAAFCRVGWSKALSSGSSSSPVGLIAGGLVNGLVVVWDPKEKLREQRASDAEGNRWISRDFELIEDYFAPEKLLEPAPSAPPLPRFDQDNCWISPNVKLIENYFDYIAPDFKLFEPAPPAPRFDQTTRNLLKPDSVTGGHPMVAMFNSQSRSMAPVRGLSFSPLSPNQLASGTENGQIMVWDMINTSAQTMPTFMYDSCSSMNISSLRWSNLLPNVFACTSYDGKTCILDISCRSPVLSECGSGRRCSSLDFSPVDKNMLLVSCEDCVKSSSLLLWDVRNMKNPVQQFLPNSQVNAMSWSSWSDEVLVCTNENKVIIWNMQTEEVVAEINTQSRAFDIHWSKTTTTGFSLVAASNEKLTLYQLE